MEQQQIGGAPTEQEEIRGGSTQDATNNMTENPTEDTTPVTVKAVKPRAKFVRESYMMRERNSVRNVLLTNDNNQRDHIYNLSIKGAIKTHGNIAVKALFTECSSLLGESSFHPISKKTLSEAELKAVIRSSCFVKEKTTPSGIVDKVKARVVAGSNQQDKSIYTLDEASSPTVSTAAVFITVAIAANEGRHVITMDVVTAYLNAKMIDDKKIHMKIGPLITAVLSQLDSNFEKYQDGKGAVIFKLDKALYGCVESAMLSYKDLKTTLEADDYRVNPYDLCVFNEVYKREQVTVIFYIDDLLGACVLSEALEDLYELLIKKY